MVRGSAEPLNVRDRHVVETLSRLSEHHDEYRGRSRDRGGGIVRAHTTSIGDVRATDTARRGEVNVGQLVREAYGDDVAAVGFGPTGER